MGHGDDEAEPTAFLTKPSKGQVAVTRVFQNALAAVNVPLPAATAELVGDRRITRPVALRQKWLAGTRVDVRHCEQGGACGADIRGRPESCQDALRLRRTVAAEELRAFELVFRIAASPMH